MQRGAHVSVDLPSSLLTSRAEAVAGIFMQGEDISKPEPLSSYVSEPSWQDMAHGRVRLR